jgi:hypothetical protein
MRKPDPAWLLLALLLLAVVLAILLGRDLT